jgi:hypothetical protein
MFSWLAKAILTRNMARLIYEDTQASSALDEYLARGQEAGAEKEKR